MSRPIDFPLVTLEITEKLLFVPVFENSILNWSKIYLLLASMGLGTLYMISKAQVFPSPAKIGLLTSGQT